MLENIIACNAIWYYEILEHIVYAQILHPNLVEKSNV